MELQHVGTMQFIYLIIGTIMFITVPIIVALIWKFKKKERITTMLVGAAAFLLFVFILEKPIQNVLLFPAQMGLPYHPIAQFVDSKPLLWVFLVALFPGVFEETGRLVAYLTVLKKRRNRETSISYGIGHGGFEVVSILGITFISYISLAFMINSGAYEAMIQEAVVKAPEMADAVTQQALAQADALAAFGLGSLAISVVDRIFAVLLHIGLSIVVFYACKDKKKFWLFPVAILTHTLMDFFAALQMSGLITISTWALEGIYAVIGTATFFIPFFLLYKKDKDTISDENK